MERGEIIGNGRAIKRVHCRLGGSTQIGRNGQAGSEYGGTAVCRPAQGTVFLDDEALQEGLNAWINQPPYLAILTTGMGLDALFDMAERMGIEERFLEVLSGSIIAARGYKTVNALKKEDLRRRFVTTTEVQSD